MRLLFVVYLPLHLWWPLYVLYTLDLNIVYNGHAYTYQTHAESLSCSTPSFCHNIHILLRALSFLRLFIQLNHHLSSKIWFFSLWQCRTHQMCQAILMRLLIRCHKKITWCVLYFELNIIVYFLADMQPYYILSKVLKIYSLHLLSLPFHVENLYISSVNMEHKPS